MASIEEAWKELKLCGYNDRLVARWSTATDAARRLALAVLEETQDYNVEECDGCVPVDPCGYHYVRARIEALGKEGTT